MEWGGPFRLRKQQTKTMEMEVYHQAQELGREGQARAVAVVSSSMLLDRDVLGVDYTIQRKMFTAQEVKL